MSISSTELVNQTGASFRQIDYWCKKKIISPLGEHNPGSGVRRAWDPAVIQRIRVMVKVSDVIHNIETETLKDVYDNYHRGYFEFENGIKLVWSPHA